MGEFIGEKNAAAAIFIYNACFSDGLLWKKFLPDLVKKHPIHVELHTKKNEFLDKLKAWNEAQEFISDENAVGDNSYTPSMLLIHAHMDSSGIASIKNDPSTVISWEELVASMPQAVSLVWLFGCESDSAKEHWSGKAEILLTCTTKETFRKPVRMFGKEVSMRNIVPFNDMQKELRQEIPTLSYFTYEQGEWKKSFET